MMMTKQEYKDALFSSLSKRKYADYFIYSHHYRYKLFPHVQLICDQLQQIINGEQKFIIVEMPPRHGKSASITETFPSYYLMKNPDKEVMLAAYSEDLYKKFGRRNRDKFRELAPEIAGLQISQSTSSASEWGIEDHSGGMLATSILGGATGRGADLLIIDDPIKNDQEAQSQTIRDRIWNEWQSTFLTRLHAGGSVIVIMTRWHEDDLVGRLLREMAFPWEELKLPAIADEPNDLLGRNLGDPLCPELGYDEAWAKRTKVATGSRTWEALYQQRPSIEGGNIFKRQWIHYYVKDQKMKASLGLADDKTVAIMPRLFDMQAQSWDATFKEANTSDFVAGQVWGKKKADFYLIDRWHERMGFTDTVNAIRQWSTKYPRATTKYVEDKANGSAIIDTLKHELSGITPVTPDGGKVVRANAVQPLWEAGNVYVPHPLWQPWVDDTILEWENFPNAPHDDEVDSMTQALVHMKSRSSLRERFLR